MIYLLEKSAFFKPLADSYVHHSFTAALNVSLLNLIPRLLFVISQLYSPPRKKSATRIIHYFLFS